MLYFLKKFYRDAIEFRYFSLAIELTARCNFFSVMFLLRASFMVLVKTVGTPFINLANVSSDMSLCT